MTKNKIGLAGVGTDIVEIGRIRRARYPDRIAELVLVEREREEYLRAPDQATYLASRFALKEAIIKASPVPIRAIDFEVTKQGQRPVFAWCVASHPTYDFQLSIAHEEQYAVAFACAMVQLS